MSRPTLMTQSQYFRDRSRFGPTGPTESDPGNVRNGGNVHIEKLAPSPNFVRVYDKGTFKIVELMG